MENNFHKFQILLVLKFRFTILHHLKFFVLTSDSKLATQKTLRHQVSRKLKFRNYNHIESTILNFLLLTSDSISVSPKTPKYRVSRKSINILNFGHFL